ncbi:MAG: UDP-N-acetyl-2-amino-2-deoxyglucuronate dehydrogenase [Micromonosporaceae bacterium]
MIDVAIVGSGIIGRNHAAAIGRHPDLRVTAVVDPIEDAGRELARQVAGAAAAEPARYASLRDALGVGGFDLVAICTPSGRHAEDAEAAIDAGRHVVIEKPLDVTLPRARRLADLAAAAQARGLVTSVISQHRFDPASVAVAEAVAAGRFGRVGSAVGSVAWWRSQAYYDSAGWRGTWRLDGGGALMNQGVHTVDLMLWLLGRPVEVYARAGRYAHTGIDVEDVATATVAFESGAVGVVHATTAAYPGLSVRVQVHGSRGSAVIHDDQLEYFHAAPDGADEPHQPANQAAQVVPAGERYGDAKPPDAFVVAHLRQYRDIAAAVESHRPAMVTIADGLLALATVRAVYLSATLRRPVAVPEVVAGGYDDVAVSIEGWENAQ